MQVLILRLESPLMSFGDVIVDQLGRTSEFPGLSLLTGLLANALGYEHGETEKIQALQDTIQIGVRRVRLGTRLTDYQTVDFSQDFLPVKGWTTHGKLDERKGGQATKEGTHIRYRDYWTNASFFVAVTINSKTLSIEQLKEACQFPARPLFIGRKHCLPSIPIFYTILDSPSIQDALKDIVLPNIPMDQSHPIWYPSLESNSADASIGYTYDLRNWKEGIHSGRRLIKKEYIPYTKIQD